MSEAMTQHSTARARSVAFCGLSIALMAVAAWVTVPFGPVPFTLQTLAVMFVLFALPAKQALVAIGGYIVLGGLGLPVFSSFKGGLAALMGPTGGFIVGCCGCYRRRFPSEAHPLVCFRGAEILLWNSYCRRRSCS